MVLRLVGGGDAELRGGRLEAVAALADDELLVVLQGARADTNEGAVGAAEVAQQPAPGPAAPLADDLGVFAGDLYYYTYDHDLAGGLAKKIDTSKVGVHLISGEFDPTAVAGPGSMAALASEIPGATQAIIKGGSHFAMSDDYPRFREVLLPVLKQIAQRSSTT